MPGSTVTSQRPAIPSAGKATAMPIMRPSRLPIGRRLLARSDPDTPSMTGLMAVPRLAPSTSAKAVSGDTTPLVASDMTMRMMATLEWASQVTAAEIRSASSGTVPARPSTTRSEGASS